MKVLDMRLSEVVPYHANPRINDKAVEAVANSIHEFGFKQPIVVDRNNVIIVGHTRWKAAKQLGMEVVPVLVAEDLDEEKVRAYRLADNKTGEAAEWDYDLLAEELASITGLEMGDFGFDVGDVTVDIDAKLEEVEEDGYDPEEGGGLRRGASQAIYGGSETTDSCAGTPPTRCRSRDSWAARRPTCC